MNKKPAPDPLLKTIGCNSKVDYPMLQYGRGKYIKYVVRISSMDAQTNKLFLKKTRIKWTDSILV